MRKLVFLFLLCFTCNVQAQQVFLKAAYGISAPLSFSKPIYFEAYPRMQYGMTFPYRFPPEKNGTSLAPMHTASVSAGYWFGERIGIEAGIDFGIQNREHQVSTGDDRGMRINHYADKPTIMTAALLFGQQGEVHSFYARAGIGIPLRKTIYTESYSFTASDTLPVLYVQRELSTKFNIALVAALGYEIAFSRHLSFFTEVAFTGVSFKTTELNVLKASVEERSFIFPEEETKLYYGQPGKQKYAMNEMPAYNIPFSSLNFRMGVKVKFDRKQEAPVPE